MTLNSFDVVFYTCLFLIPGYIIAEVRGAFCTMQKKEKDIAFLQYLLFSILNCGIWSWLYILIMKSFKDQTSVLFWVLMLAATVIGACFVGLLIGVTTHFKLARKLFEKLGIGIHLPEASAWDYKFENLNEGRWVIVTLKTNNTKIYGLYGTTSFSSSSEDGRDLYLEKAYSFDGVTQWKEADRTDGILINKDEISTVEFKD